MSDETRELVLRIGREEGGGASADEVVRRLLDEHWQAAAISAVHRYGESDPPRWVEYLTEAEHLADADAPISDAWTNRRD